MSPVQRFTFDLMRAAGFGASQRALINMRKNPRRDLAFLEIRTAVFFAANPGYSLERGYERNDIEDLK